jgi:ABC-2 type transport system permease protein
VWRLGLARGGVELRMFWRDRNLVVFTFALPVVLLVLLGSIFGSEPPDGRIGGAGVTSAMLLTAGMLTAGVASTAFTGLGSGVAVDRDDGTLRRLRGVPMPPAAYFLGKIILTLVVCLGSVAVLLGVGALLFDLPLPREPQRWLTFGWVFLLGGASCALLGIAASSLAVTARSVGAVMNLPYLVLAFISGVFVVPVTALPPALFAVGSLFPMRWMAQGFRSAFLPDELQVLELNRAWEHGRVALVLAAWCLGGLLLCLTTFRWRGRRDG